jgi:type II secretory pathway pseudopilin PulG
MKRKQTYSAFTLIEMLIVMAILIILMVIGIAAGRFALNRANDVAHQNAVDQLYQGLQAYYTDNRKFPTSEACGEGVNCTPQNMMEDPTILGKYMDFGAFNGGTTATFFYLVGGDNSDQAVLVCVSMRGEKSDNDGREDDGSYYCNGNGFNVGNMDGGGGEIEITNRNIENPSADWATLTGYTFVNYSNWDTLDTGGMGWKE